MAARPIPCPAGYQAPPLPNSPVVNMHDGEYISPNDPNYGWLLTWEGIAAEWQEHDTRKGCYRAVRVDGSGPSLSDAFKKAYNAAIAVGKPVAGAVVTAYRYVDYYSYQILCTNEDIVAGAGVAVTFTNEAVQKLRQAKRWGKITTAGALTTATITAACLAEKHIIGPPDNPNGGDDNGSDTPPPAPPPPTATATAAPEPKSFDPERDCYRYYRGTCYNIEDGRVVIYYPPDED